MLFFLLLFAQSPPTPSVGQEVVPWVQLAASGSFAALAWFLIAVQGPKTHKENLEEIKAARKEFSEKEAEIRAAYIKKETDTLAATVKRESELLDAFTQETKYERETCERRHQEIIANLVKQYEAFREMSHDVKNISQVQANDRAIRESMLNQEKDRRTVKGN